jgi:hypothetical protein
VSGRLRIRASTFAALILAATIAPSACTSTTDEAHLEDWCAEETSRANLDICKQVAAADETRVQLGQRIAEVFGISARAQQTADAALGRNVVCVTRVMQRTRVATCTPGYTLTGCTQTRYTHGAGGMALLRSVSDAECRFTSEVLEVQVRCCAMAAPPTSQPQIVEIELDANAPVTAERGELTYVSPGYFFEYALIEAFAGDNLAELDEVERIAERMASEHNGRLPALIGQVYGPREAGFGTVFQTSSDTWCPDVESCLRSAAGASPNFAGVGRVIVRLQENARERARLVPVQGLRGAAAVTITQIGRDHGLARARTPLPPASISALGAELQGIDQLTSATSLLEFDRAMRRAFNEAGYPRYAMLTVENEGMIYVSPLERIDVATGHPFEGLDRFSTEKRECRPTWSIFQIWRCLNAPDRRHWRVFTFGYAVEPLMTAVTAEDDGPDDAERVLEMVDANSRPLNPGTADPLTRPTLVQLLIYELEKGPGNDTPIRRVPAHYTAQEHLNFAHLVEAAQ